jgi:hypothetical protein
MANKPFAIQGADLTLGGVNLQAGSNGVVIPGVTRATSYVPEEVEDTGDQTYAFNSPPVVIDYTYYSILNGDYSPSGYTEAEYAVTELDGDDYIDGIDIVSQGSGWDSTSANSAQNNDMWAYVGSQQNPFATFVNTDWIQIPFRVKIRAGEVETIGGGGSGNQLVETENGNTFALMDTGDVVFDGEGPGGVDRGIVWQYGDSRGGINSMVRQDEGGLTVRAWTEVGDGTYNASVNIVTNQNENLKTWEFDGSGALTFPDGTIQTTAYTGPTVDFTTPLPGWLTVAGNTQHFPTVNYDYGFDSTGVWTVNATIQNANDEGTSYPFRTAFTVPSDTKTIITVDFVVNDITADFGIGVFATETNPVWAWDSTSGNAQANRIGAQYNGPNPELHGISGGADNGESWSLPGTGTYRARLTVNPVDPGVAEITLETLDTNDTVLDTITYTEESFFQTNYRIGFASDQDNGVDKVYFKNLTIDVDNGSSVYTDALTSYDSTLSSGGGTGSSAELVGDGYANGTGYKRVVYTDWQGYQGGESNGVLVAGSDVFGIQVGDTITFRNGEVRTITSFDTGYDPQVYVQWADSVDGSWDNPRFPMTFTSANYVAETKSTARIKPDDFLVGSGQYMEVYAGGPTVVDQKHIHMAGANADTELFLGTDNNFVSAKEAGLSPARVNLKSENDITVSDTNLRMSRGNTWVSVYGDGINRNQHSGTYDLTWNVIESDEQGNFYVGGESCSAPEAMVAKYGPDGDLLWTKLVNDDYINGWKLDGVAYNPVAKEVAVAVRTNVNRNYDYYKVNVLDSETGDFKSVFDLYDPDGNVMVSNMTWHPTLSWIAVGYTNGEKATTSATPSAETTWNLTTATSEGSVGYVTVTDNGSLPSVVPQAGDQFNFNNQTFIVASVNTQATYYELVVNGNTFGYGAGQPVVLRRSKSGVGIIELPVASVKINSAWPDRFSGTWYISGTGITGNQVFQGGGPGLYNNLPVTNLTNPTDTGLTVGIRVDYAGAYYEYYTTNTQGTGVWGFNDDFKIPGSLLGGVDGATVGTFSSSSINAGSSIVYFNMASYPTLSTDVTTGTFVRFENYAEGIVAAGVYDADGTNWAVEITMNQGQTVIGGNVIFYHGNDIVGKVADYAGIQNGFVGTPNITGNYHIDMGYSMGYGGTDFTFGTFTLTAVIDNRAFVWNHAGPAGWNKIYNPANDASTSTATCVTVNKSNGDIFVGGQDNTNGNGFVWKLDSTGNTAWIKGLDDDTSQVCSVAVSEVNGDVYYTTSFNSVNKLSSTGDLVKRVEQRGMWGMNTPVAKLKQELDGAEYLYVAGQFGAIWTNNNGYMVSKLSSDLRVMWNREFWSENRELSDQYEDFHNHIALGRDKVVMVGYTYIGSFNNANAYLASITTGDTFEPGQIDDWHLAIPGGDVQFLDTTSSFNIYNLITEGGAVDDGSLSLADDNGAHEWTNWGWKSVIVKLDHDKGIKGVESIHFAEGGKLDHNPVDIPPVLTDFNQTGWNYTLKLSDRGKFIINSPSPDDYTNHLYITVPSNTNVNFPVGSIITLINTSNPNNNGYRIYVQPENWSNSSSPRIYATDGSSNYSTWSFQGIQTATLMKIGSNEWLLTANSISNED